jgi:hypothetical protein
VNLSLLGTFEFWHWRRSIATSFNGEIHVPIDLRCVTARENGTTRENDSFLQGRHVDKRTINSRRSIKPCRRLPRRSILCRVKSDIKRGMANTLKRYVRANWPCPLSTCVTFFNNYILFSIFRVKLFLVVFRYWSHASLRLPEKNEPSALCCSFSEIIRQSVSGREIEI